MSNATWEKLARVGGVLSIALLLALLYLTISYGRIASVEREALQHRLGGLESAQVAP